MTEPTDGAPEVFDPREMQAVHRRILAAKDRGEEPAAEDLAYAARVNASPYSKFDRAWRSDDD